jgi:hypothetical protein
MAPFVLMFLLLVATVWSAGAQQQAPSARAPQNECAEAAFKKYIQAGLALSEKELAALAALRPTMQLTIARRRLQEDFCAEFTSCVMTDVPPEAAALRRSLAFDTCLRDEVLEEYEAHRK